MPPRGDPRAGSTAILDVVQLGACATAIRPSCRGGQQQRVALARAIVVKPARAAARRAAVEPRRQPARGDALRDPPPARRVPHHHRLRHPRPGRGDGHLRPHRGDEPGPRGAGRRAASALRAARARASSPASSAARTSSTARCGTARWSSTASPSRSPASPSRQRAPGPSPSRSGPRAFTSTARRPPGPIAVAIIPGAIAQRAYLGEYWDYAVRPEGSALSLRVTARPHEVFEVGREGLARSRPGAARPDRLNQQTRLGVAPSCSTKDERLDRLPQSETRIRSTTSPRQERRPAPAGRHRVLRDPSGRPRSTCSAANLYRTARRRGLYNPTEPSRIEGVRTRRRAGSVRGSAKEQALRFSVEVPTTNGIGTRAARLPEATPLR